MRISQRTLAFITLVLVVWAISASCFAVYYYWTYEEFYRKTVEEMGRISIKVDLAIDYGNKTREWHNSTLLPVGMNLFNATLSVAKVSHHYDPVHEAFLVDTINGVGMVPGKYWFWYYWSREEGKWILGPVASSKYILRHREKLLWYYTPFIEWPPKPPE